MKIKNVQWANFPDLKELLEVIQPALIVGGAVRNSVLNIPIGDIDIATELWPDDVMKLVSKAGFRPVPTGLAHGTITCIKHRSYEVTTLRIDRMTDGRHARVDFSNSWQEDASRRDFTMNALYANFEGDIFDFIGALKDLNARYLRFIGDADKRIREDYLRILRFFRFYAHYARSYDDDSLVACINLGNNLTLISRERCTYEFLKLLESPRAHLAIDMMDENICMSGGLPRFLPSTVNRMQAQYRNKYLTYLGKLAAFEKNHYLILSRKQKRLLDQLHELNDMHKISDYIKWINKCDTEVMWDGIILKGKLNEKSDLDLDTWIHNKFPLQGRDLVAIGVAPGPDIANYLKLLLDYYATCPNPVDKDLLLEVAKSIID